MPLDVLCSGHLPLLGSIFFLIFLFVVASGLTFLETSANPFISLLGNSRTSEQRLNFSQAFNPVGSVFEVLMGTVFIFSGFEPGESEITSMKLAGDYEAYMHFETMRVVKPYLYLAGFAIFWAGKLLLRNGLKIDLILHLILY